MMPCSVLTTVILIEKMLKTILLDDNAVLSHLAVTTVILIDKMLKTTAVVCDVVLCLSALAKDNLTF